MEFRPTVKLTGDKTRSDAVFGKLFAAGHLLGPAGNDIGPNLKSVANHPLEKLLVSILGPQREHRTGYTADSAPHWMGFFKASQRTALSRICRQVFSLNTG